MGEPQNEDAAEVTETKKEKGQKKRKKKKVASASEAETAVAESDAPDKAASDGERVVEEPTPAKKKKRKHKTADDRCEQRGTIDSDDAGIAPKNTSKEKKKAKEEELVEAKSVDE